MDNDTLKEAKEAFRISADAESEQRIVSLDDLKFAKLGEQWSAADRKKRELEGRPCLTINRIPAFLRQVTNDARQNRPAIKCHPAGGKADRETADILDGLIRNIEYASNADIAYDTALDFAATMGFGYFIIRTDYADDDAWDLDLVIERVANPFSIYRDPYSTAADSSDWNSAFVTDLMKKSVFEKRWPKADTSDFQGDGFDSKEQPWFQDGSILVAEYWSRSEERTKLLKLSNGSLMFEQEYLKEKETFDLLQVTVDGTRDARTFKVVQRIMNGSEILETTDWRGKYIPIIPVYGDEVNVEGKRYFKSLFRDAKDAQRMFNYWRTASTELVALAPKAPWIGPAGAFVTDAAKWATANTVSHQFIEFDTMDANGNPITMAPQRQPFAGPPAGALQEALNASDDMKSIMGIHDASLGARSNETSGRAILARQREGDVSTFHLIDNLSRGIRHAGRVLVDLIPKHYDTKRIIRVIKEDGTNYEVPINQPAAPQNQIQAIQQAAMHGQMPPQMPPGQGQPLVPVPEDLPMQLPPQLAEELKAIVRVYDVTTGKYDVTVKAGPSFTTRREEAATQMVEFVRAFPQVAPIIGDLIAENLDWPGADEIGKRLKAMLPPQAQSQVAPIVQQLQQMLQQQDAQAKEAISTLQKQIEALNQQVQNKNGELTIKAEELKVKGFEAETRRLEVMKPEAQQPKGPPDPVEVEKLRLEAEKLRIEAYEAETARLQALGAVISPDQIVALVNQTVAQALENSAPAQQSSETVVIAVPEPPAMEQMQQQPPEGGFFAPGEQ